MKKTIPCTLIAILLLFAACNNSEEHISSISASAAQQTTSSDTAKAYYDYLVSLGEIEIFPSASHSGNSMRYSVHELYYFIDDFNNDGITDLAVSAEESNSNGIQIYTYMDGQVAELLSNRMPYSAGTEIFTLAKYDDLYGIKYLRFNSTGDFCFFTIQKDGTLEAMFEDTLYDYDGNALDTSATYDRITPIIFYRIEDLA